MPVGLLAAIVVVIGVMVVPYVVDKVATDVVTPIGVVNVVALEAAPVSDDELVAETTTEYAVPGSNPVPEIDVVDEVAVTAAPPPTGVMVAV